MSVAIIGTASNLFVPVEKSLANKGLEFQILLHLCLALYKCCERYALRCSEVALRTKPKRLTTCNI